MTCTITKIERDTYSLQPEEDLPLFTLDMQVPDQAHRLFPVIHKPFNTRDNIDPGNCQRNPDSWNPPDVCVAAVERKLCEHLSNNGMGTPYSPNKTVQSVLLDISNTQGMFLNGNSIEQIFACADRIYKLARPESASSPSIPSTPTTGRHRPSMVRYVFRKRTVNPKLSGQYLYAVSLMARISHMLQSDTANELSVSTPKAQETPVKALFSIAVPPELSSVSAEFVASRIKAIAPAYAQFYKTFIEHGFDGKMVSSFAGRSCDEVSEDLEALGVKSKVHRDRIVMELVSLFERQTLLTMVTGTSQHSTDNVRSASTLPIHSGKVHPEDKESTPGNKRRCSVM
jgi:hypothetical protein